MHSTTNCLFGLWDRCHTHNIRVCKSESSETSLKFWEKSKLYILSTLNIDLIHTEIKEVCQYFKLLSICLSRCHWWNRILHYTWFIETVKHQSMGSSRCTNFLFPFCGRGWPHHTGLIQQIQEQCDQGHLHCLLRKLSDLNFCRFVIFDLVSRFIGATFWSISRNLPNFCSPSTKK